jgi:hypothetical protein
MKPIHEIRAMKLSGQITDELLQQEIDERRRILPTLIGWLYPPVIQGEIIELQALARELGIDLGSQL